jgi:hypothetical protein
MIGLVRSNQATCCVWFACFIPTLLLSLNLWLYMGLYLERHAYSFFSPKRSLFRTGHPFSLLHSSLSIHLLCLSDTYKVIEFHLVVVLSLPPAWWSGLTSSQNFLMSLLHGQHCLEKWCPQLPNSLCHDFCLANYVLLSVSLLFPNRISANLIPLWSDNILFDSFKCIEICFMAQHIFSWKKIHVYLRRMYSLYCWV